MNSGLKRVFQVLLGLFILWQIFFLLAYNFLSMLEEARPNLPPWAKSVARTVAPGWLERDGGVFPAAETIEKATGIWADISAQPQGWTLFSPNPGTDIPFVALELRWDDDPDEKIFQRQLLPSLASRDSISLLAALTLAHQPYMEPESEWLLSPNEPPDPKSFFRFGKFRLRRYEGNLELIFRILPEETLDVAKERWRELLEKEIRQDWDAKQAYLKWRLADYQKQHPEKPTPTQIILHSRLYHIPMPGKASPWNWEGPVSQPMARWFPQKQISTDYYPLQMYNPVTERFEWLK